MAEAQRNRGRLVEVATKMFASADSPVALEAVAREAGVGIGILYRHFPTRAMLVEAVYRDQIQELDDTVRELLRQHPPSTA
jgi:AcrR family transcriptional regulator